jgi:hypothetical protein
MSHPRAAFSHSRLPGSDVFSHGARDTARSQETGDSAGRIATCTTPPTGATATRTIAAGGRVGVVGTPYLDDTRPLFLVSDVRWKGGTKKQSTSPSPSLWPHRMFWRLSRSSG